MHCVFDNINTKAKISYIFISIVAYIRFYKTAGLSEDTKEVKSTAERSKTLQGEAKKIVGRVLRKLIERKKMCQKGYRIANVIKVLAD